MVALLVYHKNAREIYPAHWLEKFKDSILNQTFQDFEIYEIEYSGGDYRIFESSHYESKELPTFVHAMNWLIMKAWADGATAIANANVDDYFSLDRLEIQLPFIEAGYDVVASNFCLVQDDKVVKWHKFDELNIKEELERDHNIIGHPSVIYSRRYAEANCYEPTEIPIEDLLMWKRSIDIYKFIIVPQNLLYHRLHNQSVCQSNNR